MGQRKGYKQTPEHIAKRKRFGEAHPNWKGNDISVRSGRSRALRLYPKVGPCVLCGNARAERHHLDENTANNEPSNIVILCRRCHMSSDGRLDQFRELAISNLSNAINRAAQIRKSNPTCPKGHPYSGSNLYVNPRGARVCRKCINDYKKEQRRLAAKGD